MARRSRRGPAARRLRDDLRRLLRRHAPGAGRPARAAAAPEDRARPAVISVSLLDSMLAAQTQEAAAHLMRGQRGELGRDAAVRRVRDHGRRARDGRRLQGEPAAGHLRGARIAGPATTTALRRPSRAGGEQARAAGDLPRALRSEHRPRTGSRGWRQQDLLCAPVRTLAEALEDEQTAINGMILEARQAWSRRCAWSARPIHLSDAPVTSASRRPKLGAAHRRGAGRELGRTSSASAAA